MPYIVSSDFGLANRLLYLVRAETAGVCQNVSAALGFELRASVHARQALCYVTHSVQYILCYFIVQRKNHGKNIRLQLLHA